MRVFIKGIPYVVAVDDYIPFYNAYGVGSSYEMFFPWFANAGIDGSIWGMLMEKVWAKVNGNYEFIIGGLPVEVFDFLGGCPTASISTTSASGMNK